MKIDFLSESSGLILNDTDLSNERKIIWYKNILLAGTFKANRPNDESPYESRSLNDKVSKGQIDFAEEQWI